MGWTVIRSISTILSYEKGGRTFTWTIALYIKVRGKEKVVSSLSWTIPLYWHLEVEKKERR
jgi:hypothetical protein